MKIYMKIWMIASVVFFSSCNEWLDVKQEGEFEAESLYADGEGYRAVINKLYKMMAESTLYGENLTYGMVDCMSQQYALTEESNTNSVYRAFADFKYTDNGVPEHIDAMYEAAPRDQRHIQEYLSANCFGDYQTRPVFDAKTRELLTFAVLVSLGGCEAQVKGHIAGNLAVGNGKDTLLAVVTQLLPYIGYPRTLNGIACLNQVVPE